MGLDINRSTGRSGGSVVADRKLWLTADKDRLVEDGDPAAAFLWATPGKKVGADDAKRLGYYPAGDAEPEVKQVDEPAEDKAVPAPDEDKAVPGPSRRTRKSKES